MAAHHPVVCGRRLSIILLLVVAYFGISTFVNSGRLPERREKLKLTWRQGSRSSAEEERKSAHARALDPVAGASTASAAKRETDDLWFEIKRLDAALEALVLAHEDANAPLGN